MSLYYHKNWATFNSVYRQTTELKSVRCYQEYCYSGKNYKLYLTYSVEILPGSLLSWLAEAFNLLRILSRVMRGSAMKQATIASFQILAFSLFILIYHLFPLYTPIAHLTVMELQTRLSYLWRKNDISDLQPRTLLLQCDGGKMISRRTPIGIGDSTNRCHSVNREFLTKSPETEPGTHRQGPNNMKSNYKYSVSHSLPNPAFL
jgi:hypothetical protein